MIIRVEFLLGLMLDLFTRVVEHNINTATYVDHHPIKLKLEIWT